MNKSLDFKTIGQRIKQAREEAGLTQHDLYLRTGISITQISNYENGLRNIGLYNLNLICTTTRKTIDELLNGTTEEQPINKSKNKGELVVNCVNALYEEGIIDVCTKEATDISLGNSSFYDELTFIKHETILKQLVLKLIDFDTNKDNIPNADQFKNSILSLSANLINQKIGYRK